MAGTAGVTGAAGMETGMTGIAIHRHRPCRRRRLEAGALHVHHAQDSTCLGRGFAANVASRCCREAARHVTQILLRAPSSVPTVESRRRSLPFTELLLPTIFRGPRYERICRPQRCSALVH